MIYLITYTVTDKDVGSNPFGHTCILFSKWPGYGHKIEGEACYGYYGSTSWDGYNQFPGIYGAAMSPSTLSIVTWLKKLLGLNIDMIGNHGTMKQEEMRALDKGVGLHGRTFEVSEENYNRLKNACENMMHDQNHAINEMTAYLNKIGEIVNARNIYLAEKLHAKREGRESRLKPFELRLNFSLDGFSMKESTTCKSVALNIIDKNGIQHENVVDLMMRTFPLDKANKNLLHLHSTGKFSSHFSNRTKKTYFFREWDPEVHLFWTLPPKEAYESKKYHKKLHVLEEHYNNAEKLIVKLQKIEWLIISENVEPDQQNNKEALLRQIQACYEPFSVITQADMSSVYRKALENGHNFLEKLYISMLKKDQLVDFITKNTSDKICDVLEKRGWGTWLHDTAVNLIPSI